LGEAGDPIADGIQMNLDYSNYPTNRFVDDSQSFVELAKEMKPVAVNISTTKVIKQRRMTQPFPEPFWRRGSFS
jgi:hypothetical protein